MPKNNGNLALKGLDELLFSTEEQRQEEKREQVQQIPIDELHPFTNHPFKVVDDEAMTRTVESIAQFGVLAPLIARPRPDGDGYEIISGHRRQFAAKMAGLETLPVIVRDMDDDAATILMVDSNLQREHISPSERAFAYKMKLDALKNQGARSDLTSRQVVGKLEAADVIGKATDESGRQVQRYLVKSGLSVKDAIAPTAFAFKNSRTFQMGGIYCAASFLSITASDISDQLLKDFLDMDSSQIVTMHIQSVDQNRAIKTVKRTITELDRSKIEEQKKAIRAGYDIDIIPSDLATYGRDAKALLKELQSQNERMFLVTFLVLNTGRTEQKLENNVFQASSIAQKHNCNLCRLDYQQEQGLMSSLPLADNQIEIQRGLTTSSTAIFIPFTTQELYQSGKESLYYGLNALSNNLIIKKFGALLVSAVLCIGMAAPAFAYEGDTTPVEEPVLPEIVEEEDAVTITDEETGALTPEGNLTLVDDYHTNYSDGSGQQFITMVSKSGATFYLVIDRNAKGQQTVHFMNLVDEADLLALMEEEAAEAYNAEKEAAKQAELDKLKAEEEAKKAAEEAAASDAEQPKENKVTKYAAAFLGVVALIALVAGGGFYFFIQQKHKKQAEKEAADPDADYTEDNGNFEIPPEDDSDDEDTSEEQDVTPI